MEFDLFAPGVSDDDVAGFRLHQCAVLIEGSVFGGEVAIVPNETAKALFPGAVCYFPEEIKLLLNLDFPEALKLHKMKTLFGGHVQGRVQ